MNFFKKLFGGGNKDPQDPRGLVEQAIGSLIEVAGFDVEATVTEGANQEGESLVQVELHGNDDEFLCQKEGQVLEAISIFLKRVVLNRWPDDKTQILVDAAGFSEANERELIDLAEKLRDSVINKKRPVYCRALPPKDRKIIHRHLSEDLRIKTRSVGEGNFKKIKIYLASTPMADNEGDFDSSAE